MAIQRPAPGDGRMMKNIQNQEVQQNSECKSMKVTSNSRTPALQFDSVSMAIQM
jgi:hypothetical protein